MSQQVEKMIARLKESLPPFIAMRDLDRAEYSALPSPKTIRNLKCSGKIPADCFIKDGPRRVIIDMEAFLAWWGPRLSVCNSQASKQSVCSL